MRTKVKLSTLLFCTIALFGNGQERIDGGARLARPKGIESSNGNGTEGGVASNEKWGGSITFNWGNYPSYTSPYYGYNNNYNNLKRSAKNSIRMASMVIGEAAGFNGWHDIYSPILAKSIRHYKYAQQLYKWRDYHGAMNHAERARFLAIHSLNYFQSPFGYSNGGNSGNFYPDPYGDPYNPYYRSGTGDRNINETSKSSENFQGEKKNVAQIQNGKTKEMLDKNDMDLKLPSDGKSDKELIKSFEKFELDDE